MASEPLTPATVMDAIAANSDLDTSSSSDEATSESDNESFVEDLGLDVSAKVTTTWLFNQSSLIIHMAVSCSEADPLCTLMDDTLGGFKTACGVRPVASEQTLQLTQEIPAQARLCLRYGCIESVARL